MATGVPARWVLCAVLVTARVAHAQTPPEAPLDRPPVTSPTAPPPPAAAPPPQPTIAQATGRRQVAVIDLTTQPDAELLANELYNALVNHLDLRPLANPNFVRSLKGPFADEEAASIETAKKAKVEADEFLVQLDYPSAERAALAGEAALLDVRPAPDVLGLYAELAFAAGQSSLGLRKPNDASLAFGLSFRLDPSKRPDPARYPPDIVEAYQLAAGKPPVAGKLEVTGTGTVWIDGIDRGVPGTFDVASGLHVIQLIGGDRETRGRQVAVPATTSVAIDDAPASEERKVERARLALAAATDPAARAGAIKKLATLLGVGDAVLIDKGEDGTLVVQTWRDRDAGFSARKVHKTEPPIELLTSLAPARKLDTRPFIIPLPPPAETTPWWRTKWAKGAGAAVLVSAIVGIYVASLQTHNVGFDGNIGSTP